MAGKFEVFEDKVGKWRFRLKMASGQVVAVGEAFETNTDAREGCEQVRQAADDAAVTEV